MHMTSSKSKPGMLAVTPAQIFSWFSSFPQTLDSFLVRHKQTSSTYVVLVTTRKVVHKQSSSTPQCRGIATQSLENGVAVLHVIFQGSIVQEL
jgi:hypothetical protein